VQVNPVSGGVTDRWISFLSRANYGYKEKYFLTGVVRYDGRSSFAEGHKWTLFPGISGSWHLSQESFMSNSRSPTCGCASATAWWVIPARRPIRRS